MRRRLSFDRNIQVQFRFDIQNSNNKYIDTSNMDNRLSVFKMNTEIDDKNSLRI